MLCTQQSIFADGIEMREAAFLFGSEINIYRGVAVAALAIKHHEMAHSPIV